MSSAFSLVCDDCKLIYWAGQADYIYSDQEIAGFLHNHVNHKLRFINDLTQGESTFKYKDVEGN